MQLSLFGNIVSQMKELWHDLSGSETLYKHSLTHLLRELDNLMENKWGNLETKGYVPLGEI